MRIPIVGSITTTASARTRATHVLWQDNDANADRRKGGMEREGKSTRLIWQLAQSKQEQLPDQITVFTRLERRN